MNFENALFSIYILLHHPHHSVPDEVLVIIENSAWKGSIKQTIIHPQVRFSTTHLTIVYRTLDRSLVQGFFVPSLFMMLSFAKKKREYTVDDGYT